MERMLRNLSAYILMVLLIISGMGESQSIAGEIIEFGPEQTKIIGTIDYSVIGQYIAQFREFKGNLSLDQKGRRVNSVNLEIEAKSIVSNCPWCDRLARSRRLLNTARYPKIIFKSAKIIQDKGSFKVKGTLEMHGIKKAMTFPFSVVETVDQQTKRQCLAIKGTWSIDRREFNIIWNKYLDQGGVLVGNTFTVDWQITVS